MKINFNMDIRIEAWAKALGYTVVGNKLIHSTVFELKDFEECVSDYISESLESGTNSAALEEIFFANDDEQHILRDMLEECEKVELTPEIAEAIADTMPTIKRLLSRIDDGVDAVFLPGKLHGCEDQLYVIYYNAQGCSEKGCFEIEILDYERIIELYEDVNGDAEKFFDILPDRFQGEWKYCDSQNECFADYVNEYFNADFIFGRDGDNKAELEFILNWAKARRAQVSGEGSI